MQVGILLLTLLLSCLSRQDWGMANAGQWCADSLDGLQALGQDVVAGLGLRGLGDGLELHTQELPHKASPGLLLPQRLGPARVNTL